MYMQRDIQRISMNSNDTRPFGFWITAVDRLMRAEFATVFEDEGITRHDWRMLNRIDGTHGDRPVHDRRGDKMRRLTELGWIERTRDGWALTESGILAKQRLGTSVDGIRARIAGVLSDEEYAAMTASLEKIAREFGWEEGKPLPRRGHGRGPGRDQERPGFGRGHGHAHGFDHGHGHAHGFDHGQGHAHGHSHGLDHGHGHRHGGGHRHMSDGHCGGVQHVHFHTHH